ncbi:MAG: GDP-L-fucose synthase [Desulfovibrionales bacterium]|nr:GDP-L-fucose synthase [Desulfovibrionales bacterium]
MEKDSKIYVAGYRGLVGSAIARHLKALGYTNLILLTSQELDLKRQSEVEAFFARERPEYVFVAAARVGGILANNTYPADFIYDNIAIQTNLIHASYMNGVKKLLFLGSSCIYPRHCPQPMKEKYLLTGPLEPTNEPYAVAKIAGIKMCQSYNRQYGTNFMSVMPTNLYGPNDNFDLETSHVLPALIRKFYLAQLTLEKDREGLARDEAQYGSIPGDVKAALGIAPYPSRLTPHVTVWGSGSPRREFLHVDDLADACIFIMRHINATAAAAVDSDIINIGCGQDLAIKELAELTREVVGLEGELIFDTTKPDGTPRKLLDVSKLKGLGWEPRIGLRDGIRRTYEWYRQSGKDTFTRKERIDD